MTTHEQYKLAFSVLQTTSTPEQVLQRTKRRKGVFCMKKKYIPILIGAILLLLLGTVVASELHSHWLSRRLQNVEEHPEITAQVQDVSACQTVDGTSWTIDHLLVEGRTVFWQLTKHRADGAPVEPYTPGEDVNLVLLDADGKDLGIGYSLSLDRLDDGSDPSTCTLLYCASLATPGYSGEVFAGMTLYLAHMQAAEPVEENGIMVTPYVPVVTLETVIQPYSLREMTTADGIGVNVGRLCIEIQGTRLLGEDFDTVGQMANEGCALILADGRELPVQVSVQVSSELSEEEQWQIAVLPEIIAPEDAAAIRVGQNVYPLSDK